MGRQPTGNVFKVGTTLQKKTRTQIFLNYPFADSFVFASLYFLRTSPFARDRPSHFHFASTSSTPSGKKSLQKISRTSLCGLNRVAVDVEPAKGDAGHAASSFRVTLLACGKKLFLS